MSLPTFLSDEKIYFDNIEIFLLRGGDTEGLANRDD
jgi:hypothetical protein